MIRLWICAITILLFASCSEKHAGTGLETSTVQLSLKTSDGAPASRINVQFFPSGARRYTDSTGSILWDTTQDYSLYAGGYREALIIDSVSALTMEQKLKPIVRMQWASPVTKNLIVAEAPNLGIKTGESTLNGLPSGNWTLVENQAEAVQSWPFTLNESGTTLDSTLGSVQVESASCGILRGEPDIAPSQYCWFTKVDTVIEGDSIVVEENGNSLNATFHAGNGYGVSSSVVALALRFGGNRIPVDLTSRKSFTFYGYIAPGDSLTVSVVTFDGVWYGFWNQLVYGSGQTVYQLPFEDFKLTSWSDGVAPISSAIGFDFTLPGTSDGTHTLTLDSLQW